MTRSRWTRAKHRSEVPVAPRRAVVLGLALGMAAAPGLVRSADTPDAYPSKPIRFVVPFPPGGITDRLARMLGQRMQESMGQPVIVENRAGAGATVGSDFVAKAKPDGYTILLGAHASHAINVSLMKLPYDAVKDFAPISLLGTVPNLLLVRPSTPVDNVKELIALAKAKPGTLTYTSAGVGTSGHMAGELLESMAGIDLVHVPNKGAAQALNDAVGGHVDIVFDSVALSMPLVRAGKLKALAVTSLERSAAAPNIPTMAEAGVPGYEIILWFAVFAPAGTPAAIVQKLHAEVVRAFDNPQMRASFAEEGLTVVASSPDKLAEFQRTEIVKWSKLIKTLGLAAN